MDPPDSIPRHFKIGAKLSRKKRLIEAPSVSMHHITRMIRESDVSRHMKNSANESGSMSLRSNMRRIPFTPIQREKMDTKMVACMGSWWLERAVMTNKKPMMTTPSPMRRR